MRVLVLGATGMAGHIVCLYLQQQGHNIEGFSKTRFKHCPNIIGDATDFPKLKQIIDYGNYGAIVNCIGILNSFADENKGSAILLNSYLPQFLVDTTQNMQTKIIHMSTDCVFSGQTGGYREDDMPDGKTFYDRSKALGEINDTKNITFRNSIVGPDMNVEGIGLFNWFMKQDTVAHGYNKAIWSGVTTLTLAKAMEQSLKENVTGLINLVNNTSINKFELLCLFNKYFKNSQMKIVPSEAVSVDKSLVRTRTDFSFRVPPYEAMVAEMAEWVNTNRELYPHYFRGYIR